MEKNQLFIPEWLVLDRETREKLAEMFSLKRDIATEVANNQVMCDGYSNEMLKNISLEAIKEKGIDGIDFLDAFTNLLKSLEPKEIEEMTEEQEEEVKEIEKDVEVIESTIDKRTKAYKDSLK